MRCKERKIRRLEERYFFFKGEVTLGGGRVKNKTSLDQGGRLLKR